MKRFLSQASVNFLFLFLALFGGVFSLVYTFSIPSQVQFLFWTVFFSAVVVSALRTLPRAAVRGWLYLAAVLTLGLLLWWHFDQVWVGGQVVFHKVSLSYHQAVSSVPYYVLPETLTLSEISAGVRWFFGLLIPLWALWAGLFLGPSRRTLWPILLSAAVLPAIGLVILLEPPLLPALALVLLLALSLLAGPSFRLDPDLGVRRTWAAVVPVGIVLALIVAAVPPADYVRSPKADEWRTAAMEWANNLGLTLQGRGSIGSPGAIQNFSDAGPLEFDGHTVLTVEGAAPGTLLLRGFSSAVYGEKSWQPLPQSAYDTLLSPPEPDFPFTLTAQGADNDLTPTTATIRLSTAAAGYLYVPYQLDTLPSGLSASAFSQDAYISRPSSVRGWQISYYPDLRPDDVTLVVRAAQWETSYRGWVYRNYTSVPARIPTEVLRPAELQGLSSPTSTQGRLDAARRVTQYLSQTVRYDQQTPVTPKGEDFVTYFLTQSRQGYCLHYASAATLMLRAMGIPTRFVSGYMAYVPYEGAAVAVPDSNAHAWVEIYLDGYGWYPVDVTNGFSGSMDTVFEPEESPSPSPSVAPVPSPSPSATPAPSPTATPSPVNSPSPTAPDHSSGVNLTIPWRALLISLAAVCAAAGIAWGQRRFRLGCWRRAMTQPAPNQAVLAVYRYLTALERRGEVPVEPAAEFLAQKAAFSQHTLSPAEVRSMQTLAQEAARLARAQRGLWKRLLLRYFWALV